MRKKKSYRIFLIALMTLSTAFGLSSCIDEDMSKCGKDYKIKYNLVLNTQIHTLIDIDLNTTEERHIANRLKQELGTVFTRPCPRQRFVFLYRKRSLPSRS